MITLVENVTPAIHAGTAFVRFREQFDFRTWAEGNPQACLRRFSIKYSSREPAAVSTTLVEENSYTFEVAIAYPVSGRFGADGLDDLEDTITSDLRKIYAVIGPPGYASFTAPATVIDAGDDRETSGPVMFGVMRFRVDFYRSLA